MIQHQGDDNRSCGERKLRDGLLAIVTAFVVNNNGKRSDATRRMNKAREQQWQKQSQATEASEESGPDGGAARVPETDEEQERGNPSDTAAEADT